MKILGRDYALRERPDKEFGHRGWWDGEQQTIDVAASLHAQGKEETVLHEIIHALDFMMVVNLDETQVQQLAHGLYEALTANGVSLTPLLKDLRKKS